MAFMTKQALDAMLSNMIIVLERRFKEQLHGKQSESNPSLRQETETMLKSNRRGENDFGYWSYLQQSKPTMSMMAAEGQLMVKANSTAEWLKALSEEDEDKYHAIMLKIRREGRDCQSDREDLFEVSVRDIDSMRVQHNNLYGNARCQVEGADYVPYRQPITNPGAEKKLLDFLHKTMVYKKAENYIHVVYLVPFVLIDVGFHQRWNNIIGRRHPVLWHFMRKMKDEQRLVEVKLASARRDFPKTLTIKGKTVLTKEEQRFEEEAEKARASIGGHGRGQPTTPGALPARYHHVAPGVPTSATGLWWGARTPPGQEATKGTTHENPRGDGQVRGRCYNCNQAGQPPMLLGGIEHGVVIYPYLLTKKRHKSITSQQFFKELMSLYFSEEEPFRGNMMGGGRHEALNPVIIGAILDTKGHLLLDEGRSDKRQAGICDRRENRDPSADPHLTAQEPSVYDLNRHVMDFLDHFNFIVTEESAILGNLEAVVRNSSVKPPLGLPCRERGCPKAYKRAGSRVLHEKDMHGLDLYNK
ncbi:Hypp6547 [Branchiostoma lanceolatum]|uniref:Hypp6547 protein n=1 Tax=Branchiostoma lanceolatum TaxID=7740 RepID=A0A8K0E752_BRALA|nr:Hypp6547 [Branchiostoma lanceolatum]